MSTKYTFRHFVEQELGKFPHFVIYAFLEWTLISLLFLDGFLALVSTEFAEFFDLHTPCILCTRIDHVLTKKRAKCSYNDSICEGHKRDLSPLAYCCVHRKLCDIRRMCEGCLLSYATGNDCEAAYSKSINGALSKNMEGLFDEEMKARFNMMQNGGKAGNLQCSCCGDPMKVKSSGSGVLQRGNSSVSISNPVFRSLSIRVSQVPSNSPRAPMPSRFVEEARAAKELPHHRSVSFKLPPSNPIPEVVEEENTDAEITGSKEDVNTETVQLPGEPEHPAEEFVRNPSFAKLNRIFSKVQSAIDSAGTSPRFANRFSRKCLLERVELASDPVEEIMAEETDTEAILNRLKNQVREDKKSLITLYMELDEERNASAVAANNAMAMITRLQAEKAAVQMEALQYQRMMEEQAEYGQESLEMLRDCLAKTEDEIREIEAELDLYRQRYGVLPEGNRGHRLQKSQSFSSVTERSDHDSPLFSIDATDTEMEVHDHISDTENVRAKGDNDEDDDNDDDDHNEDDDQNEDEAGGSLVHIERERSYLLGQIRMLESRILLSSADRVAPANNQEHEDVKEEMILKEVAEIGKKLRALEEDSRFLKHALLTLQKDRTGGSKLLMEIAESLENLRQMAKTPLSPTIAVLS